MLRAKDPSPTFATPQNDDRLVDGVYREAGSLIAAPQSSANHTEIPALFRADSVMLGVLAQKPDKMRGTHGEWVNAKTLFQWQRSDEDVP